MVHSQTGEANSEVDSMHTSMGVFGDSIKKNTVLVKTSLLTDYRLTPIMAQLGLQPHLKRILRQTVYASFTTVYDTPQSLELL